MIQSKHFAAFIITYNRSEILLDTIENVLNQTCQPDKILIVDNSSDGKTENLISEYANPLIEYLKVGYNSGPAGGSQIGLEKLSKEGYEWIYWGDDNNPPRDSSVFKRFFQCLDILENRGERVGMFCGKGGKLNRLTGRIRSLSNSELALGEIVPIDVVAGGQTLLVNAAMVKEGILPDSKLFFAFEDLDISLKAKSRNYKVYTDAKTWLAVRAKHDDTHPTYRPVSSSIGKNSKLNREFYSTRNLMKIFWRSGFRIASIFILLKSLTKAFYGFRFGFNYGTKNFKLQTSAIKQFLSGNSKNTLNVHSD